MKKSKVSKLFKLRRGVFVFTLVAVGLIAFFGFSMSSSATAVTPPKTLMIKTNDLSELPSGMGNWNIVGCGITALVGWTLPPVQGAPSTGPCASGQDPIYTSYTSFQAAVNNGTVKAGSTVIFDPEKWLYTPSVESNNRTKYLTMAGQLAQQSKINLVYTPQGSPGSALNAQFKIAAKYGSVVEIQSQFWQGNPVKFKNDVNDIIAVVRAINPKVPILAGFASDPNGKPATVADMVKSYDSVSSNIQGIQLNLAVWRAPDGIGCAPTGCSSIGVSFLNQIGIN